jgi:hypothetical protein
MSKGMHHRKEMCEDHWFLDLAHSAPTKGEPFFGCGDRIFCPKCLTEITGEPGYGLAYGGIGTYWVCDADNCEWFFKKMDDEEG